MDILITGGAGFVGSHLIEKLVLQNEVLSIDNYFTGSIKNHIPGATYLNCSTQDIISNKLPQNVEISMIRIWNYNKSRIHSFRGARLMTCELDGDMIFKGEISKAPGNTQDPEACCEIILFTEDESILFAIDSNDWLNEV